MKTDLKMWLLVGQKKKNAPVMASYPRVYGKYKPVKKKKVIMKLGVGVMMHGFERSLVARWGLNIIKIYCIHV